jgi:hypothetical protein
MGPHVVTMHHTVSEFMTVMEYVEVNQQLMNVEFVVVTVLHACLHKISTAMEFSMENHIATTRYATARGNVKVLPQLTRVWFVVGTPARALVAWILMRVILMNLPLLTQTNAIIPLVLIVHVLVIVILSLTVKAFVMGHA